MNFAKISMYQHIGIMKFMLSYWNSLSSPQNQSHNLFDKYLEICFTSNLHISQCIQTILPFEERKNVWTSYHFIMVFISQKDPWEHVLNKHCLFDISTYLHQIASYTQGTIERYLICSGRSHPLMFHNHVRKNLLPYIICYRSFFKLWYVFLHTHNHW